jgi:hypothetical protein
VIDQERDVVLALPQGRHLDRHHVQPIVQVLPEPLLPDLLLQKSVGYDPKWGRAWIDCFSGVFPTKIGYRSPGDTDSIPFPAFLPTASDILMK